jgi:hypothetical protein
VASRPIRSEQIEAQYRRLLPAQAGNETATDLLASDTIIPVVNITGAAEGQALREDLQRSYDISSSTTALSGSGFVDWITTSGFWQVRLVIAINPTVAGAESSTFINDGTTSSIVFSTGPSTGGGTSVEEYVVSPEFTVFLRPGDVLRTNHPSATASVITTISYRQVADLYGNLTQPTGFTFQ